MRNLLPEYYQEQNIALNIVDLESDEVITLNTAIEDFLAQMFVNTATWGLDHWESILGIQTIATDSYEVRRARIIVKISGSSTMTRESAQTLVNTLRTNSKPAEFVEYNSLNSFLTRFDVDGVGTIKQVLDAFNIVKPAHLKHIIALVCTHSENNTFTQKSNIKTMMATGLVPNFNVSTINGKLSFSVNLMLSGVVYNKLRLSYSELFSSFSSAVSSFIKIYFSYSNLINFLEVSKVTSTFKIPFQYCDITEFDSQSLGGLYLNKALILDGTYLLNGINPNGIDMYNRTSTNLVIRKYQGSTLQNTFTIGGY